jgi:hypothetical protein
MSAASASRNIGHATSEPNSAVSPIDLVSGNVRSFAQKIQLAFWGSLIILVVSIWERRRHGRLPNSMVFESYGLCGMGG